MAYDVLPWKERKKFIRAAWQAYQRGRIHSGYQYLPFWGQVKVTLALILGREATDSYYDAVISDGNAWIRQGTTTNEYGTFPVWNALYLCAGLRYMIAGEDGST